MHPQTGIYCLYTMKYEVYSEKYKKAIYKIFHQNNSNKHYFEEKNEKRLSSQKIIYPTRRVARDYWEKILPCRKTFFFRVLRKKFPTHLKFFYTKNLKIPYRKISGYTPVSYATKFMISSTLSFDNKILIIYDKNAFQNNSEVFITEVIEYS